MAFFKGEVKSSVLRMNTSLNVILPYDFVEYKALPPCKVLYLLHGYAESADSFQRWTRVEWFARKFGVAVVMPEVNRSCYVNMKFGMQYFDYITNELPQLCHKMFNISSAPSDTFVSGQSMGGYGALKWFLHDLEKFGGVATMSGSFDLQKMVDLHDEYGLEFSALFGESHMIGEQNDVLKQASKKAITDKKIYVTCGTDDIFLADSQKLKKIFDECGTKAVYNFEAGEHTWEFWEKALYNVMEFFFS